MSDETDNNNEQISKLTKKADSVETLIDVDKGIFVNFGVPEVDGAIIVPNSPHVFMAGELNIQDKSHKKPVVLKDVPVVMAHGIRDDQDDWKFFNGQSVPETVVAYNRYAKKEGLPLAEFLIVCNKDKITEEYGVFIHETGLPLNIAYAAGEEIGVSAFFEDDGSSKVYVTAQENIANLDILQVSREIKFLD